MDYLNIVPTTDCCGCGACCSVCPMDCIEMLPDKEGFLMPVLSREENCIHCGKCRAVCPVFNKMEDNSARNTHNSEHMDIFNPVAYAVVNNSEEIRSESASGGVFSLFAQEVLANNGVVFGATLSEDCRRVVHIAIDNENELWRLRGSKYVQSDVGSCYRDAEVFLESGRQVLFTGTPCQIEGLYSFLKRPYKNLICIDLICHGVPSPTAWERYINCREESAGSKAVRVSFRDKNKGWGVFWMTIEFADGSVYSESQKNDSFLYASLDANICLRNSCHNCKFKTAYHSSDLTIADLWGIDQICPEWNDDKGVSLLLIQSSAGKQLFEKVSACSKYIKLEIQAALSGNSNAISSEKKHRYRDVFLSHMDDQPFDKLVSKYGKKSLLEMTRGYVGDIYRNFFPCKKN